MGDFAKLDTTVKCLRCSTSISGEVGDGFCWQCRDRIVAQPKTAREAVAELSADPGTKYDAGKLRLDLIPPEALEGIANVLGFGAAKYGEYNWAKGIKWSRCHSAALRHLLAWFAGESKDPESGFSHLDHALCNLAFLKAYEARGMVEFDDRPNTRVRKVVPPETPEEARRLCGMGTRPVSATEYMRGRKINTSVELAHILWAAKPIADCNCNWCYSQREQVKGRYER